MDFKTATHIAQTLETSNPELVVSGIRQVHRQGKRPTWTIDVINRENGMMTSLDEKDDWTRCLQEILPDRTREDARLVTPHRVRA